MNFWNPFRKKTVNEKLLKDLIRQVKEYDKEHPFKSQIIMDYILSAYKFEETTDILYQTIFLGKDKMEKADQVLQALSMSSPYENQQYEHWRKGTVYTIEGISIPVTDVLLAESQEVFHTEKEVFFPVFFFHNLIYHNFTDEVLVIYNNGTDVFARPYEMFFDIVEDEGIMKPRFKKI